MRTIPLLKEQQQNSLKLILIGIVTLLLAQCTTPYNTYTYETSTTDQKGTTTQPKIITHVHVPSPRYYYNRPAYVAPGYHSYSNYYCRPRYYWW